jgi:hypothetical protein
VGFYHKVNYLEEAKDKVNNTIIKTSSKTNLKL